MECKKFTFKEKLSETRFLDDLDFNEEFKIYVDCPTSGGKSYYILNHLKEREIKAVFVVDTINLAKQLSAQYQIPYYTADHREDFNSSLIITIQHHIPKFESRETVIIDEAHTLVTQIGWKGSTIEEVMTSLEFYKRIIFLSGTPVTSDDNIFKGMQVLKARKEIPDKRELGFVPYKDLAGGIIELCLFARRNNKIPVISLLDKSTLLPEVIGELKKRGIKRIAAINSETKVIKKEGQKVEEEDKLIVKDMGAESEGDKIDYLSQLVNECRIDAEVIFTTYTQGYSLLGKNYLLVIAPGKNRHTYVDIVQMMNRFREDTSVTSLILTNATWVKEEDSGIYNFPSIFDFLKDQLTTGAQKRMDELVKITKSTRKLKRQLKLQANEFDQYINVTREIDHQGIAFSAFKKINYTIYEQLHRMNKVLQYYNITLCNSGLESKLVLDCDNEENKENNNDNNKIDHDMKKQETLKAIDLFYKSKQHETTTFMGKEYSHPVLGVKIDKDSLQYTVERTYKELLTLGLQDEEIRELQEQHLHNTKKMNQVIACKKIRHSTDPTLITFRTLLLSEFKVGERLTGDEITERMNKLLVRNRMEKMMHNNAVQYFRLLFHTKEYNNHGRSYEIIETF